MKNNKEYKCVIIGNGEFPKNDDVLNIIYNAEHICCCDGAAELCIRHGIRPEAIVGDGDSLSESFKSAYKDILYIEEEQEDKGNTPLHKTRIS